VADFDPHAAVTFLIRAMFLVLRHRRMALGIFVRRRRRAMVASSGGGMGLVLVVTRRLVLVCGAVVMPCGVVIAIGDDKLCHAGRRRQERRRKKGRRGEGREKAHRKSPCL
jgi:hypothetical protein